MPREFFVTLVGRIDLPGTANKRINRTRLLYRLIQQLRVSFCVTTISSSNRPTGLVHWPRINNYCLYGSIHSDRNRGERAGIGEARSAGTGVYMPVYEDAEHRATPMPVRAVDLCRHV
jgi:hypothetical protein